MELVVIVVVVLGGIMGERLWHGNFSQPLDNVTEPGRVTGVLLLVMVLLGAIALLALAGLVPGLEGTS